MTRINFKGLATGVGSLPFDNAKEALELILRFVPEIPFWPQLPRRDKREGMVAQFSENFPCLSIRSGELVFDPSDRENELQEFYEKVIAQDAGYFAISPEYAAGLHYFLDRLNAGEIKRAKFIKSHITGPFTFCGSISDEKGKPLLFDKVFFQAVVKGLAMKAKWQIGLFSASGKKSIVFIDEPFLGSFGSAYTPINRQDVITALSELASDINDDEALLGVHCCGNTDWSIFTQVPGIKIISFDAFEYLDRIVLFSDNLKPFIQRGGILCWGIVPTSPFEEKKDLETVLLEKIKAGIDKLRLKGLNAQLLLNDLLISPACGFGSSTPEQSELAFSLLSNLASRVKEL